MASKLLAMASKLISDGLQPTSPLTPQHIMSHALQSPLSRRSVRRSSRPYEIPGLSLDLARVPDNMFV